MCAVSREGRGYAARKRNTSVCRNMKHKCNQQLFGPNDWILPRILLTLFPKPALLQVMFEITIRPITSFSNYKNTTQQNLPITKISFYFRELSTILDTFITLIQFKQTSPKFTEFLCAFKSTNFSQFNHTVNIITLQHINLITAKLISPYRFYRRGKKLKLILLPSAQITSTHTL